MSAKVHFVWSTPLSIFIEEKVVTPAGISLRTLVIGARALALFLCSSTERCTIIKCSLCYGVCLNLLAIDTEAGNCVSTVHWFCTYMCFSAWCWCFSTAVYTFGWCIKSTITVIQIKSIFATFIMVGTWGYWIVLLHNHKSHQINLCIKKRLENTICCKENKIVSVIYACASVDLTLFFLCGICDILEHEGPLLEARTSHVLADNLKCAAHAFFKFANERSPYSKFTNSRGCIGLKVCLLSGSEASCWTMISQILFYSLNNITVSNHHNGRNITEN